jgi:hypothetical protein
MPVWRNPPIPDMASVELVSFALARGASIALYRGSATRLGMEADYVWNAWKARWPSHIEPRDVTEEDAQAIAEAHSEATHKALRARRSPRQIRPASAAENTRPQPSMGCFRPQADIQRGTRDEP